MRENRAPKLVTPPRPPPARPPPVHFPGSISSCTSTISRTQDQCGPSYHHCAPGSRSTHSRSLPGSRSPDSRSTNCRSNDSYGQDHERVKKSRQKAQRTVADTHGVRTSGPKRKAEVTAAASSSLPSFRIVISMTSSSPPPRTFLPPVPSFPPSPVPAAYDDRHGHHPPTDRDQPDSRPTFPAPFPAIREALLLELLNPSPSCRVVTVITLRVMRESV